MFDYKNAKYESVSCNFCGGADLRTFSKVGQDNLPLRAVICKTCGLIFINPRMSAEWYFKYYQSEYREKTVEHGESGRKFSIENMYKKTLAHGERLGVTLKKFISIPKLIVEVGSSAGGVLKGMQNAMGGDVYGIEPSEKEARFAEVNGVPTLVSLFEEADKKKKMSQASIVVCTQSLNHLLDPKKFLAWAHDHLLPEGILVLEVVNFRHQLRQAGKYKNAVKIDHPYMFTPEVLTDFVKAAGFEILCEVTDEELEKRGSNERIIGIHAQIVARKTEAKPFEKIEINENNYKKALIELNPIRVYIQYLFNKRIPKLFK